MVLTKEALQAMPGRYLKITTIRTKLILAIATTVLLICTGTAGMIYIHACASLHQQIRARLATLAYDIALEIDPESHRSLQKRSDESKPEYKRIKQSLMRAKSSNPDIRYIYTMKPGDTPKVWNFVVDAETDPKLISHTGDEYDVSRTPELKAGLYKPTADRKIIHDKWGYFLSGYAPIRTKDGTPIGIVGVDMSVDQLVREMGTMRRAGIICAILAIVSSVLLSTLLAKLILRPLNHFIKRLDMAAHGDLSPIPYERAQDEIGQIAQSFNNLLSSLREKEKMLSKMSTDYLTGLPNHRHFQEMLECEIDEARKHDEQIAILMVDVDKFKSINDQLGYRVGDEILRQVSKLAVSIFDTSCTVARYGGEEFAIILPGTSIDNAVSAAEKLREVVECHDFTAIPSNQKANSTIKIALAVTVSIGAAVFPDHSKEQNGLIMASEIALYRAKHLGRNRVSAYDNNLEDGQADPYEIHAFIQDPSRNAIEALAAAVDARDHYTAHHSQNVSKYSLMIADNLGMNSTDMELLHKAALLHDVGKIGVPDSVLNKPGDLTDDEMELIRTHPSLGEAIVRHSRNLDSIIPGILYHHERYDGGGYPYGVSGEDIPFMARIIAVADTFDALTTNRPYRDALTVQEGIEILRRESGTQFDPHIVKAFIDKLEEGEFEPLSIAA